MTTQSDQFRLLPSVDELLHTSVGQQLFEHYSHTLVVQALRAVLAQARAEIRTGAICQSEAEILATASLLLLQQQQSHLRPVINATGVIINTNLGRAPLST